jgi:hypothetical protein
VGPDARSLAHRALELIRRAGTFLDLQFVTAWKMDGERRMVDEVDQALVEGSPRDLLGGFVRDTDLLLCANAIVSSPMAGGPGNDHRALVRWDC